jgi:hypothetical protein
MTKIKKLKGTKIKRILNELLEEKNSIDIKYVINAPKKIMLPHIGFLSLIISQNISLLS